MSQLTEAQKQLRKAQQENLKAAFETLWRQLDGPALIPEYRFSKVRDWRFDYVSKFPYLIAIELEGGTWLEKGAHTTGQGYTKDCTKYNEAQLMGYRIFRFTTDMLTKRDGPEHLQPIIDLMKYQP